MLLLMYSVTDSVPVCAVNLTLFTPRVMPAYQEPRVTFEMYLIRVQYFYVKMWLSKNPKWDQVESEQQFTSVFS